MWHCEDYLSRQSRSPRRSYLYVLIRRPRHTFLSLFLSPPSCLMTKSKVGSTYDLDVWSASELFVIIVCGCIPPMRPIFVRYFGSKEDFKGYGYNLSGYGSSQRGMPHKIMSLTSTEAVRGKPDEELVALRSRTESPSQLIAIT